MNIRKAVDYSTMFATLESVMKADLPQMELYCEIGKAVCAHSEKGAAVAAAEFIKEQYHSTGSRELRHPCQPGRKSQLSVSQ